MRFDAALQTQFLNQPAPLWPVLKGSLSQVAKPCIRPRCPACAKGDKHPAFLWTFTEAGRRRCLYVEARLVVLGPAWLGAWRAQRKAASEKG